MKGLILRSLNVTATIFFLLGGSLVILEGVWIKNLQPSDKLSLPIWQTFLVVGLTITLFGYFTAVTAWILFPDPHNSYIQNARFSSPVPRRQSNGVPQDVEQPGQAGNVCYISHIHPTETIFLPPHHENQNDIARNAKELPENTKMNSEHSESVTVSSPKDDEKPFVVEKSEKTTMTSMEGAIGNSSEEPNYDSEATILPELVDESDSEIDSRPESTVSQHVQEVVAVESNHEPDSEAQSSNSESESETVLDTNGGEIEAITSQDDTDSETETITHQDDDNTGKYLSYQEKLNLTVG